MFHPNLPLLGTGANKHDRPGLLRHSAEALGVGRRLDLVHELKVREVVDEDFVLEYHDDAVAPEPDASYGGAEGELPDAAALVVVPDHDLVRRVVGIIAAADEREYVAAEQHLDDADTPSPGTAADAGAGSAVAHGGKVPAEDLAEGVAVVDAEARLGARREAAVVLVEGDVEEVLGSGRRRRGRRRCGGGSGG